MISKAGYLTTRFGAYLHREVPEEDAELSHVGADTPCGEYLRRFWQPICFSDELKDLPHRVKILGEELVVFRDRSGAVGLLELHCPHRGASLEYGLIDAKGIQCCYHGWLFAADGTILETPGEPADRTLKDRLFHGAYPTYEYGGMVFAIWDRPTGSRLFPCTTALSGRAVTSCRGRNISTRATSCRSWRTPWIPPIRRFFTPSSAVRYSPVSLACCRNWSSSRRRWA